MKIYISLPITGRDFEDVEADSIFASGVIQRKGHTPVSPLEVSPDPDATYAEHIGTDITALLVCDVRPVPARLANARLHRQGQKYPVTVYNLICAGTVDERACAALEGKKGVQQSLLDSLNYLIRKHCEQ